MNISWSSFFKLLFWYNFLCSFMPSPNHHNQGLELVCHHKRTPWWYLFVFLSLHVHAPFSLFPGNHLAVLHLCTFDTSASYTKNSTIFLRLTFFFTKHNSRDPFKLLYVSVVLVLSCWVVFIVPEVCSAVQSLKNIQFSNILPLWIKLVWTFVYKILYECKFSFLWDKCPRMRW